jgi:hypothetical protein
VVSLINAPEASLEHYNPETESEAFDEMQDLTMKPK